MTIANRSSSPRIIDDPTPAPNMHESHGEKDAAGSTYVEQTAPEVRDLTYENPDEEPELHLKTYFAVAALFLLNFVQVFALTGPPVVVRCQIVHFLLSRLTLALTAWSDRRGSLRARDAELDPQCILACPGGAVSDYLIRVGYFPGKEADPGCNLHDLVRWSGPGTKLEQHGAFDCCTSAHRLWLRRRAPRILCPQ